MHTAGQAGRLQGDGACGAPFDLRLDTCTAGFADDPVDDFFTALVENLHGVEQHLATCGRSFRRPIGLGFACLVIGGIEVFAVGQGDLQQARLREGIEHIQRAAGTTGTPLAGERLQFKVLIGRASSGHGFFSLIGVLHMNTD
ncbi:hypothetical protein D9M73_152060 [compost metagenome]